MVDFMLGFLLVVLLLNIVMFLKEYNANKMRALIYKSISDYRRDKMRSGLISMVDYGDMEPYDNTVYRLYDWGYKRIIPKDKYVLIEKYIEKNIEEKRKNRVQAMINTLKFLILDFRFHFYGAICKILLYIGENHISYLSNHTQQFEKLVKLIDWCLEKRWHILDKKFKIKNED